MITKSAVSKIATRETHVVQFPRKLPATPGRLIIVNHGIGQTSFDSALSGVRYSILYKQLTDAGFHLLHFDGVPTGHWANDATIARLTDVWTWAKANLPIRTDKVDLLGFSHGNTLSCAWARQNPTQVQALASIIGVVNVQDVHDNDRGALRAGIQGAFNPVTVADAVYTAGSLAVTSAGGGFNAADAGRYVDAPGIPPATTFNYTNANTGTLAVPPSASGTGWTVYRGGVTPADSIYATHSPSRFPADLAGIPQRHWYSTDDTVALPSELTTFVAAVGSAASAVPFGTVAHSVGPQPLGILPAAEIADWFTARN